MEQGMSSEQRKVYVKEALRLMGTWKRHKLASTFFLDTRSGYMKEEIISKIGETYLRWMGDVELERFVDGQHRYWSQANHAWMDDKTWQRDAFDAEGDE